MTMKFRGHETFFIRKGWLSKGMKNVRIDNEIFVNKNVNPMDVLGIGTNMVKSLRYWLRAVGLTEEPKSGKRVQNFTKLGDVIFNNDRYIEEYGTLYLLQYKIASNKEEATAWYFFFNEFQVSEFQREDFVSALQDYIIMNNESVASRSLNDDFNCIINTYLPRSISSTAEIFPENNIDSPFGELGLIDYMNKEKKTYRKAQPAISTFNPWIVLAVIMDQANGKKEIALNDLMTAPCNIGRVFNLNTIGLLDVLYEAEKTGKIKIVRTSGLDVIRIFDNMTFQDCVTKYYESIGR